MFSLQIMYLCLGGDCIVNHDAIFMAVEDKIDFCPQAF